MLFLAEINVIKKYAILSKAPYFIYSGKVFVHIVRGFMDMSLIWYMSFMISICHLL